MSEADSLFTALQEATDRDTAAAIKTLVYEAPDRALCRINVLDFAAKRASMSSARLPRFYTPRDWGFSNSHGMCCAQAAAGCSILARP
jgi:Family of unknown function (DUF5939)